MPLWRLREYLSMTRRTSAPSFGWNDREPEPTSSREREQIELDAELAMVAPLGLLQPVQVRGEGVL